MLILCGNRIHTKQIPDEMRMLSDGLFLKSNPGTLVLPYTFLIGPLDMEEILTLRFSTSLRPVMPVSRALVRLTTTAGLLGVVADLSQGLECGPGDGCADAHRLLP